MNRTTKIAVAVVVSAALGFAAWHYLKRSSAPRKGPDGLPAPPPAPPKVAPQNFAPVQATYAPGAIGDVEQAASWGIGFTGAALNTVDTAIDDFSSDDDDD
jgi:hypothetical protein